MPKVYVKEFGTNKVIKEIDVSPVAGTSNYERFTMGIRRQMNLDRYYLDESEVQKEGGSD